jgi:hypothetical protein
MKIVTFGHFYTNYFVFHTFEPNFCLLAFLILALFRPPGIRIRIRKAGPDPGGHRMRIQSGSETLPVP